MTDDPMLDDDPQFQAQLAALADGSLPAGERERVRRRAATSPELAASLEAQSHAVRLVRATEEVTAPASLRARVEELSAGGAGRRRRTDAGRAGRSLRPRFALPAVAVAAAVAVVIVVLLGTGGAPTVAQTEHLALASATAPAPVPAAGNRDVLDVREAGISFPAYLRTDDRDAIGLRRDTLGGRRVTTVFYRTPAGGRVGYAIVSGAALAYPAGRAQTVAGVRFVLARGEGATLVTWRRRGHTCVIAGRGASAATLLGLAVADDRRAT